MKNFIVFLLILTVVTTVGNQFNLPSLDEDIHTTSRAAILAMWMPIFAVIALIPYLPYYAAAHMNAARKQAANAQEVEPVKCQAPAPIVADYSTDPAPVYVGKIYTSIGCNCSVRVKSLKAQPKPERKPVEMPETLLIHYILN